MTTAHPTVRSPASRRAERWERYARPLPADSVVPPVERMLEALRRAIPHECVRLDNAIDTGRMHPGFANAEKHALRHALRLFEQLTATGQGGISSSTDETRGEG